MAERDDVLKLVDELLRRARGSSAQHIEVQAEGVTVSVRLDGGTAAEPIGDLAPAERAAKAEPERVQRVRATTVGIFSTVREWKPGEDVKKGTVLGAIQSLGHMADIAAPADGTIQEVLAATGAPVEYGQPLFAISLR